MDKNVIGNLVRQLNHVNNPKGISIELWDCEDYDLSDAVQSDMFVALFHKEANKLSFDGVEKANEAYSIKKSPKVFIYFKDLGEGETTEEELTRFKQHLCDELGHFVNRYFSEDSIKFSILMQVMQVEGTEKAEVRSSKVVLGDEQIADLNKIPFAGNNPEYQKLLQELTSVNSEISQFQAILSSMENEALDAMLFQKRLRREQLMKEIEESGRSLMSTAEQIAGMYGQISSERLRKAVELFEGGDNRGANAILDFSAISEEMAQNATMLDQARAVEESARNALLNNVNECRLKIKTLSTLKESGWFNECCRIYESVINVVQFRVRDIYLDFMEDYAVLLYSSHHYSQSEALFHRLVEEYRKDMNGINSTSYARWLRSLAQSRTKMGQFDMAETDLQEAISILSSLNDGLSFNHKYWLALSYGSAGNLHSDMREYSLAESDYIKAISIYEELGSAYDDDSAMQLGNLAQLHSEQGRYELSIKEFIDVLKRYENLTEKGGDKEYSIDIARNRENLAVAYYNSGNIGQAKVEYGIAYDILMELFAEWPEKYESSLTDVLGGLANILSVQGDYSEAENKYLETIEIYTRLSQQNPFIYQKEIARSKSNLASTYAKAGKNTEAIITYHDALAIYETLSVDDPEEFLWRVARTHHRLGGIYFYDEQDSYAEEEYEAALQLYTKQNSKHPHKYDEEVADITSKLAYIHYSKQMYEQSIKEYRESLSIYKALNNSMSGNYNRNLAYDNSTLAYIYSAQNKHALAEECLQESIYYSYKLAEPKLTAKYKNRMAYLLFETGRYEECLATIDEAIKLSEGDPQYFDSKGEFLLNAGHTEEALKMWMQVVEKDPDFLSHSDSSLCEGLCRLGKIYKS